MILALTISIPILQIIWRIAQRRFGIIYMVDSTIEIVVSALFILKIVLNLFLSSWRPIRFYLAPLAALGLNLGIGVGDLILCELVHDAWPFTTLTVASCLF